MGSLASNLRKTTRLRWERMPGCETGVLVVKSERERHVQEEKGASKAGYKEDQVRLCDSSTRSCCGVWHFLHALAALKVSVFPVRPSIAANFRTSEADKAVHVSIYQLHNITPCLSYVPSHERLLVLAPPPTHAVCAHSPRQLRAPMSPSPNEMAFLRVCTGI